MTNSAALCSRVRSAVGGVKGIDPDALDRLLSDTVDADALNRLFRETTGRVAFEYYGDEVTVTGDVSLDPPSE